ncbi:MAG: hypothetical protein JNL57_01715 [Bacteroidetes bacterium]|nr:hypothetical protein [Bacteroidota bacterium]
MHSILYLSQGPEGTGGHRHERVFCETLAGEWNHCRDCFTEKRFTRVYKGIFGWIRLGFAAFSAAKNAECIVTTARLAWPVWFRIRLSRSRMIVILHNYDPKDGKPGLYHFLLRKFVKTAAAYPDRMRIVCVSKYWQNVFEKIADKPFKPVVFPNLFVTEKYLFYRNIVKKNPRLIHLGMWSEKLDIKACYLLVNALTERGYVPYFSTPDSGVKCDFPLSYFATHEAYLKQMALSNCTIVANSVNEGWNRVVHESFLVGTQVLAMGGAGMEELVKTANGCWCHSVDEILNAVEHIQTREINAAALEIYNLRTAEKWSQPIVQWLKS